jgi:hypothetical protein
MNRRLALIIAVGALVSARRAVAQETTIGYQGLPHKATGETQTGIALSDGVLLHVGAGAEAGYDSNVFYSNSTDPGGVLGSGILRFTAFGELTNTPRGGAKSTEFSYDARVGLTYRRYTSTNPAITPYRDAFMPTAGLSLGGNSGQWTFGFTDNFVRLEDPPYAGAAIGSSPISRDDNLASVQAQFAPGGGRITGTLRYNNILDHFESGSGFEYADSLQHQLVLDLSWKWLPKTAVFFQASQSYITYLSSDTKGKTKSYPLRIFIGLRGLITQKLSAVVSLGYVNAFYASGATNTGIFGSTYAEASATYMPTQLSRVTVGFREDVVDSVIASFYYDTSAYASYVQQFAGRFAFDLSGRLSHQNYEALLFDPTHHRSDNIASAGATLDYFIRNWVYAGVGYSFLGDFSDYHLPTIMGGPGSSVGYVKHQVFARLGVTY